MDRIIHELLHELREFTTLRGAAGLALALAIGGVGGAWLGGVPPDEQYDALLRALAPQAEIDAAEHDIRRVG